VECHAPRCVVGAWAPVTILVVGLVIILFGIVIPPRAGRSLEFAVAVLFILLGLTNLRAIFIGVQTTATALSVSPTASVHLHPTDTETTGTATRTDMVRGHSHHEEETLQARLDR